MDRNDEAPYRFTGKELDGKTGLYYYGARYLDPKTARWLSADPAMGDYLPSAPVNDEARKRNGNLPGQGGIYNWVNLHAYHYAGNNPVKYVDPDGKWVFMAGITVTIGAGTAGTYETGIAVSKDKTGNWQVGTYQMSGIGFLGGMGASVTASFSWAPFAREIGDVKGMTETIGGSGTPIPFLPVLSFGGDVNIPIDGSMRNFYISGHIGISTPGAEGHIMTTTTQTYGEGASFDETWNNAAQAGMFDDLPQNLIPSVGNIPKSPLARGSLGAVNQCGIYEMWYVSPHIITFLSERRYPAACGGVLH